MKIKGIACLMGVCATMAVPSLLPSAAASLQAAREATIEPETRAKIILQSRLSSKLSEPGDTITAVLDEPIFVGSQMVMARGTEFHGRVTAVLPAKRPQKTGQIVIIFDRLAMPWGEEPVSIVLITIDDWSRDQKLKADSEGKVKGGHDGAQTAKNVERGAAIGGAGAGAVILTGAAAGAGPGVLAAGGGALAAGLLGGLLLTKGADVRLQPGTTFRIKFVKPLTLPVIQQPGVEPRPADRDETERNESKDAPKKPLM
jgi:hypothetical protein